MDKIQLNAYRNRLEKKLDQLEHAMHNRDAITIEKHPDAVDETQHAAERDLAIRNLDLDSNLLRNVRAALRRIDEGRYGTCLRCEENISPKRLDAVPWAAFCIICQEKADKDKPAGNNQPTGRGTGAGTMPSGNSAYQGNLFERLGEPAIRIIFTPLTA